MHDWNITVLNEEGPQKEKYTSEVNFVCFLLFLVLIFFIYFFLVLSYLVASHAVAVENADLLVLFASHVVQALVGLHITDLSRIHTDV